MFPPGIKPGTICVLGRCDNHYTTETSWIHLRIKCLVVQKIISLKEYCWPVVCRTFQIFLNGLCSKPWTFSCANFYLCDTSIKCPPPPSRFPNFLDFFFVPKMPLDEIAVVIKLSSCEHLLLPENNISFHEKMFCAETWN